MVVKRKAIFKRALANTKEKKYTNAKKRLTDAFKGIPKRPGGDGMIHLDPREWGGNGGFGDVDPGFRIDDSRPGGGDGTIRLDPREWNGGFNQSPEKQLIQNAFANQERSKLQALLQQRQFQNPQPGPGDDGGIQLDPREWGDNGGFQGAFDGLKGAFPPPQPQLPDVSERFAGFKDKFLGGGIPHLPPRADPGRAMQPLRPTDGGGAGSIRLDPREWGENGGFNQMMPKLPNPPMKQQPVPMPGMKSPMPNPRLGGGMPPQGPKQMPMPNPRRNLIPRPIDPRYKLM